MALNDFQKQEASKLFAEGKTTMDVYKHLGAKSAGFKSPLEYSSPIVTPKTSFGGLIADIPQDVFTGVKQLGEGYQDRYSRLKESGSALVRGEQGIAETGAQFASNIAGGAVADTAYQLLRTGASFATTPEEETAIAEKVGKTVQDVGAKTGITNWYTGLDDRTKRNVNAALDIADVLPVGIFGKVKSAFKGRQAVDATPKIEDAMIRAEQGDVSDAVRIANTTLDETTRVAEVEKLGQAYQDSLVGNREKVNRRLQEQANDMSRGNVVVTQDDLLRNLADEGVIPDLRDKLADFTAEIRNLDKRQDALFTQYEPILAKSKATASIGDFSAYAKRSIRESRNLKFELDKAEAQIDRVIENLRRSYGLDESGKLTAKQIDDISREANAQSKAYRKGGNTFEADIYSELGRGARTWLNDNIPDNAFREVNDQWLRIENLKRTAESMQNQQIDVGLLGRALGSYVTTLTGVTLASSVSNPFLGVAAGILTKMGGDAIADALRSTRFSPEIRARLQERLTTDKALIEKLKQTATTEDAKNLYDQLSRMLPAPKGGALRSEVGSGAPITMGGKTPSGVVEPGITERVKEGAIRQPEGTATPTAVERAIARDQMAVDQALMEMEAEIESRPRGENIAVNSEGQYYKFKTLPTWIPKELRDGNLLDSVMKNISEGKKPRADATQQKQLQDIVEGYISDRIKQIKNTDTPTDTGVFSGDIAFAAALIAGGTYYLTSEDGTVMPVVAMGAMMKNPRIAKLVKESDIDKKFRRQGDEITVKKSISPEQKRVVADALDSYDESPVTLRGMKDYKSTVNIDRDFRLIELKAKNASGKFTDADAIEAQNLLQDVGALDKFDAPKVKSKTDTLDPKSYKSAEELTSLNPTGGVFVDYTPKARMEAPLGQNMTTLAKTMKKSPNDIITIYRGAPKTQNEIVAGDFVTTNPALAETYGENVISKKVRLGDVLDDIEEPSLGEETLYRPNADKEIAGRTYDYTKSDWYKNYVNYLVENTEKFPSLDVWIEKMKASGKTKSQLTEIWNKANKK